MSGFPPSRRLRRPREFKAVFSQGRRLSGPHLSAVVANGADDQAPRLGLAIAKRAVAGAVERNRIKRQIRESFRRHLVELPPVDVVFTARHGAGELGKAELSAELEQIWKRVRERWRRC